MWSRARLALAECYFSSVDEIPAAEVGLMNGVHTVVGQISASCRSQIGLPINWTLLPTLHQDMMSWSECALQLKTVGYQHPDSLPLGAIRPLLLNLLPFVARR